MTQPSPPLGEQRVKRQGRLPAPRRIGDHREGSPGYVQIGIRQVVLAHSSQAKSIGPWGIMDVVPSVIPRSVVRSRMSPLLLDV